MLTVSNYHYIRAEYNEKYPSIYGVTPLVFKEQLLLFKKKGDFINARNLVNNIKEILESKDNYFLIAFDDGLKEQFDNALPILDEFGIPVIFFVNSKNFEEKKVSTVHKIHLLRSILSPSNFLKYLSKFELHELSDLERDIAQITYRYDDKKSAQLKYLLNYRMVFEKQEIIINKLFDAYFDETIELEKLYMNTENILTLANRGYLGSHSHSHFPLGLLNLASMKFELENSKLYLDKLTKSKIEIVAYPYGSEEACTNEVAIMAKETGYKIGFTTKRGINTFTENHLLLNRFDCNDLPGGKNYK